MINRAFKNEIVASIRAILSKCLHDMRDENEEVWLSKDEFLKQFQMFSESWLREYGDSLPRTQAIVTGEDGEPHTTRMAYPRNKIQAMIRDGRIKQLECRHA